MRIIRYLKQAKGAVALIVALLIVQAFADLSLPRYTSDLVDVGIQQAGIEEPSPEVMRAETFDLVCMMAPADAEDLIRASYGKQDDATYALNSEGFAQRESLDEAITKPLVFAYFLQREAQGGEQGEGSLPQGFDQQGAKDARAQGAAGAEGFDVKNLSAASLLQAYGQGVVSKAQILEAEDELSSKMSGLDESLITQQAIAAVHAEYEALDVDTARMQMSYLASVGMRMLAVAAVMVIASISVSYVASRTAAKIAAGLRQRLFERVVTFSDAEIQKFSAASLITRGTNDIQQIQMVLTVLLRMVLYAPILATGGVIMISRTDVSMSWIIALAIGVIVVVLAVLMGITMPKFKAMQKLIDRVNLVSREMLTGLPVIRAFDRQAHEEARFDEANTALMRTQLFTNRAMTFMMPAMMLVMNGVSVLIVWAGGHAIDAGAMQTGDMIAFITYSMVIIMSFLMLGMVSIILPRAAVAAGRVDEVIETESSIKDPEPVQKACLAQGDSKARDVHAGRTVLKGAEIRFDHVTFAYDSSSEPVIEDITFTAPAGKTTAIIGPTGSGKSTIVKLIERFYDVSQGFVTFDGVDVRAMAQHDLRAQLGYVPQKAFLFAGTIESAITCGNDAISTESVERAASIAQAGEFIASKEEGLDSPISQGGTNVSGGQRQRLAIARALATDARVLLFDDSFSALDYKTDAQVRAALEEHMGNRTALIVAQRIATIMHADHIVVLEDGRLVGQGTHEELLRTCPTYLEIAQSQLSAEELGLKEGDAR